MITKNQFEVLRKSVLLLTVLPFLVFRSSGLAKLNNSPLITQALPAEERTAKVLPAPRMPPANTVAITAIRNLKNKDWLQDLEIEVQNNSSKPIYFLSITLQFPDLPARPVLGALRGYIISLDYGRWTLIKRGELANSEDVPINPGEKYTFKIPESKWKGFETSLAEDNLPKGMIRRINIRVYMLSYGDGTGYKMGAPFSFNKNPINNSSSRDRPKVDIKSDSVSQSYPYSSGKSLALHLRPISHKSNAIIPQAEPCGPALSGCRMYEQIIEGCPSEIARCATRMWFRGDSSSNPDADCIGWIDYNSETCQNSLCVNIPL